MYDRVLRRFQICIQSGQYVMTTHAQEEMEADGMTLFDVESCVLTGAIVERQRDRMTSEWKYIVHGRALSDVRCAVVAKLTPTRKLGILTVYVLEG